MQVLAWDTETSCFGPGNMAPPLTCITWCGGSSAGIEHHTKAEAILRDWLSDENLILVGQNVAYDFAVVCAEYPSLTPLVFQAYENNRITDTMLRQQLLDIAAGCYRGRFDSDGKTWIKHGYSLFDLARRLTGRLLKKDGWRMRYGELRDIPLSQWESHAAKLIAEAKLAIAAGSEDKDLLAITQDAPRQVLEYPLDDARLTLECFQKQEPCATEYLRPQFHEARAAFALHLSSCWGMRTNAVGVEELRVVTEAAIVDVKAHLVAAGLVRKDGSRDTKAAAAHMGKFCMENNIKVRRTKGGGVSLDEEACTATEDALLLDYAKFTQLNKALTADYPMLLAGVTTPIHPRYGLAETLRTTCSGPNLQNVSKR